MTLNRYAMPTPAAVPARPRSGPWRRTWYCLLWLILAGGGRTALAADANWGVIPVGEATTISFAAYDITTNFTDKYSFSLQTGTDASYAVTVTFDVCARGCGNPDLSYGLYNDTGQLVSDTGTATLSSGNYYLQVKGTGMGSGNSVDYSGSITFMVSGVPDLVSAVPEPGDLALTFVGISCLAWGVQRRRQSGRWRERPRSQEPS
jgi:hypothetical protein